MLAETLAGQFHHDLNMACAGFASGRDLKGATDTQRSTLVNGVRLTVYAALMIRRAPVATGICQVGSIKLHNIFLPSICMSPV